MAWDRTRASAAGCVAATAFAGVGLWLAGQPHHAPLASSPIARSSVSPDRAESPDCDSVPVADGAAGLAQHLKETPGYAGVALASPSGAVDLFGTADALDRLHVCAVRALPSSEIRLHAVANDLLTMRRVHDRVLKDGAVISDQGIKVYSFWPDFTIGLEHIQVADATPAQIRFLLDRYGRDLVRVTNLHDPPTLVAL